MIEYRVLDTQIFWQIFEHLKFWVTALSTRALNVFKSLLENIISEIKEYLINFN